MAPEEDADCERSSLKEDPRAESQSGGLGQGLKRPKPRPF